MPKLLLLLTALAMSCFGFACLALSMARHWEDVTGEDAMPGSRATALRAVGYSALAASFALALLRDGPSFGSLLWVLVLTLGAITVAFALTWKPPWLALLAKAARVIR